MAPGIQIKIRQIAGPWPDIIVERGEQNHVMSVVPPHLVKGVKASGHAAKPKMLSGMWQLPPYSEIGADRIQLVTCQLKVLPRNFEGTYLTYGGYRFKLVIYKPSIGFLGIEVDVVCNEDIAGRNKVMKFLYEEPIILGILAVATIVWERLDSDGAVLRPAVSEA